MVSKRSSIAAAKSAGKSIKNQTQRCIKGIPPCLRKTRRCIKKTIRCLRRLYKKINFFCIELCNARTPCWINIICFLPVLVYLSIKIYVVPCIGVVLGRVFTLICCCFCRLWCPEDYIFTDNQFPANIKSLQLEDKDLERSVLWIRGHEFAQEEDPEDGSVELKVLKGNYIRDEDEDEEYEEYEVQKEEEKYIEPQMYLFRNGINPSDVVQGQLGDCWLLAAIASLAEFPGAIENCFCSYEKSERHKYYVKLYDARRGEKQFKKIYIDDYIPCNADDKRPIFAKPRGNELWVLLLEKAFAKFVGNYGRLDGGHSLWAFEAMTGCHCMRLEYDTGNDQNNDNGQDEEDNVGYDEDDEEEEEEEEEDEDEADEEEMEEEVADEDSAESIINGPCWRKWQIEYDRAIHENPRQDYGWIDSGEAFDNQRLWNLLRQYDKYDALIAASATNISEKKRTDGIVEGHAYTVKQAFSFKKYKLVNCRNPWGSFEWNGKWSDTDLKTWNKHKKIAKKLKFEPKDDGSFWIEFKDFLKIFNVIEICDRTTISNLHLNINEDADTKYKLSIVKGCCIGCGEFWCLCQGLINVYFKRRKSSKSTIDTRNSCLALLCPHIDQGQGKSWKE